MRSDYIYSCIRLIAGEPSRNVKIAYLKEFLADEDFRKVIKLAYDPFITFGIKVTEYPTVSLSGNFFSQSTFEMLKNLEKRKLTGNAAKERITEELSLLEPYSLELLRRILNKDLKAGFDVKSINKARPKTIPEFPYMRCSLPSEVDLTSWNWKDGIFVQEKADGLFCNITMFKDLVTMQTRNGQLFPDGPFDMIRTEYHVAMPENTQAHGEILVIRDNVVLSRKEGNGIINHVMKGGSFASNEEPHLIVWDLVDLDHILKKVSDQPYISRLARLRDNVHYCNYIHLIKTKQVHSYEEAIAFYRQMRKENKEGAIAKKPEMIWKSHTSKDQVKLKNESVCSLRVIDFLSGTGKNEDTFGSLLCVSECGQLSVAVSGFTDEARRLIHKEKEKWLYSIIDVKFNELIEDKKEGWSLFSPRFDEARFDRNEADTLERIQQIVKEI